MPELNLEAADKITEAALGHAAKNNWRVTVAVLDAGGHAIRLTRMDGCNFLSPEIARGKAYAAAAWRKKSGELASLWGERATVAAGMVGISGSRIVPIQGAVPIWDGARCVGAVGVSGAKSSDDEECASVGIRAAGFSDSPS